MDDKTEETRFIRLKEVLDKTGLSRSSLYNKINEGKFPDPINLDGRSVAWLHHEVEDWQRKRIHATRNE